MRRSKFCVRHEASSVSLFMIVAQLRESETDVTLQLTKMRELDDERDQILTHRQNQSIGGRTEKTSIRLSFNSTSFAASAEKSFLRVLG